MSAVQAWKAQSLTVSMQSSDSMADRLEDDTRYLERMRVACD